MASLHAWTRFAVSQSVDRSAILGVAASNHRARAVSVESSSSFKVDAAGPAVSTPCSLPLSSSNGSSSILRNAKFAAELELCPDYGKQKLHADEDRIDADDVVEMEALEKFVPTNGKPADPLPSTPATQTSSNFSENEATDLSPHEEDLAFSSLATLAVHAGEREGRPSVADTLTTPLVMTSTYFFKNTAHLIDFVEGRTKSFEYGRYGNPTVDTVEKKLSGLEGAEDTLLSASGMCAATTMLLALVPEGGHIVTTTDCYRRTRQFIQTMLPKMGITTTVLDPADIAGLEAALKQHKVSLFFSESPTNPYLRCIDVEQVSKLCHEHGAIVCIDGTFATPINQRSIPLGADLILHSATKYLAGHNDVLAGALCGKKEIVDQVRRLHNVLGGVVDPHAAYLILRGMKTLDLRVSRQNDSAMKLARTLERHPKVLRVHYPGLESHPEHHIAIRQMRGGYGGVVSFEIDGDLERTSKFIDGLRIPYIAPSLGGVESLVEQPTIISYWDYGPEERARIGIKDNLVRFSVGIESFEDIVADVLRSLDAI